MICAYALFLAAAPVLGYFAMHAEESVSALVTVAEMFQCLAMLLLAAQVLSSGSVAGISARSLGLEAAALAFRLSSHLNYNGYLPTDLSGDWFFQGCELCALAAAVWLLHQVFVARRESYQEEDDSFPVAPLALACFLAAAIFHADLNARPFFDTLWMTGLNLGAVAVLPQLWLITRNGGKVDALMCHYIASMALGRALRGYFMWLAREDLTCSPILEGINHAMIAILGAELLHLLLVADFGLHYVRALAKTGLSCVLDLEDASYFV